MNQGQSLAKLRASRITDERRHKYRTHKQLRNYKIAQKKFLKQRKRVKINPRYIMPSGSLSKDKTYIEMARALRCHSKNKTQALRRIDYLIHLHRRTMDEGRYIELIRTRNLIESSSDWKL